MFISIKPYLEPALPDRQGDRGLSEVQPQADQARTDFALLESRLETIAGQIARVDPCIPVWMLLLAQRASGLC
jgi:hypothetical protein